MNPTISTQTTAQNERCSAAYEALLPQLDAMGTDELAPYTLDATHAASVVFVARQKCAELEKELAPLPIDHQDVARLETYAFALMHCTTLLGAYAPEPSAFAEELTPARTLYAVLLSTAESLALRNKVSRVVLEKLRGANGHRELIERLGILGEVLAPFAGTFVDPAELKQAEELHVRLTKRLASRNANDELVAELQRRRQKLGALLTRAYGELQAAVSFLRRREKDASSFTPSLYVPRKNQSKKSEDVEPAPTPAPKEAPKNNAASLVEEPSDNPFEQK